MSITGSSFPAVISRRRLLATAVLCALPLSAAAQQTGKVYRIGVLSPFSPSDAAPWHHALVQGLRDLGWIEGQNLAIEYRYADGRSDRLADLAADLVRLGVDVIVVSIQTDAMAAKRATRTIPIVAAAAGDPVAGGLVENLARPGGNITGLTQMAPELAGKRLELLKEVLPKLSRVAVLWNSKGTTSPIAWKESQVPARTLGLHLQSFEVRSANDLGKALEDAAKSGAGALAVMPDPLFAGHLKQIADLALKMRLPSVFHLAEFAEAGGLMAYGPDRTDMFRRAATYVDKILKGARPGDLPIEQPAKFELVINLKTAKALGVTIPPSLLLRANHLIE